VPKIENKERESFRFSVVAVDGFRDFNSDRLAKEDIKGDAIIVYLKDISNPFHKNDNNIPYGLVAQFLKDVPKDVGADFAVLTGKSVDNPVAVLVYLQPSGPSVFVPFIANSGSACTEAIKKIDTEISRFSKNQLRKPIILHYGTQNPSIDVSAICTEHQVRYSWRSNAYSRPVAQISAAGVSVDPANTILFNATPTEVTHLNKMGLSPYQLENWRKVNARIESKGLDFQSSLSRKSDFIESLKLSSKDIVLCFLHSDGSRIFFRDGVLTMEEVEALPTVIDAKPRVLVLISCNTGKSYAPFWGKAKAAIAETFVRKGLFTTVLAPNKPVNGNEAIRIMNSVEGKSSLQDVLIPLGGWIEFVDNEPLSPNAY
jgi:hypothetical protein